MRGHKKSFKFSPVTISRVCVYLLFANPDKEFQTTCADSIEVDLDVEGLDAASIIEDCFESARDGFFSVGVAAGAGLAECCAKYIDRAVHNCLFTDEWLREPQQGRDTPRKVVQAFQEELDGILYFFVFPVESESLTEKIILLSISRYNFPFQSPFISPFFPPSISLYLPSLLFNPLLKPHPLITS